MFMKERILFSMAYCPYEDAKQSIRLARKTITMTRTDTRATTVITMPIDKEFIFVGLLPM